VVQTGLGIGRMRPPHWQQAGRVAAAVPLLHAEALVRLGCGTTDAEHRPRLAVAALGGLDQEADLVSAAQAVAAEGHAVLVELECPTPIRPRFQVVLRRRRDVCGRRSFESPDQETSVGGVARQGRREISWQ
jgi:hypothetical protein